MPKIRYEVETGKVNLITHSDAMKDIPVKGCQYVTVKKYPHFDRTSENLYVKDGKLIAIRDTQPPLHRVIGAIGAI
jgi:hypothetical protein